MVIMSDDQKTEAAGTESSLITDPIMRAQWLSRLRENNAHICPVLAQTWQ